MTGLSDESLNEFNELPTDQKLSMIYMLLHSILDSLDEQ
jgi:hypothetical protein